MATMNETTGSGAAPGPQAAASPPPRVIRARRVPPRAARQATASGATTATVIARAPKPRTPSAFASEADALENWARAYAQRSETEGQELVAIIACLAEQLAALFGRDCTDRAMAEACREIGIAIDAHADWLAVLRQRATLVALSWPAGRVLLELHGYANHGVLLKRFADDVERRSHVARMLGHTAGLASTARQEWQVPVPQIERTLALAEARFRLEQGESLSHAQLVLLSSASEQRIAMLVAAGRLTPKDGQYPAEQVAGWLARVPRFRPAVRAAEPGIVSKEGASHSAPLP